MIRHKLTHDICPQYRTVLEYGIAQGFTMPSLPQQKIANAVIDWLVHRDQWQYFDTLCFEATDGSEGFSRINYINPGTYNLVKVGSPTFTTNQGWKNVSTTAYISTGFNPFANGVNVTRRNNSMTLWRYDNVWNNGMLINGETNASVDTMRLRMSSDGGNHAFNFQDVSGDGAFGILSVYDKLFSFHKTPAALETNDAGTAYRNGILYGTTSTLGGTGRQMPNTNLAQGLRNNAGVRSLVDTASSYSIIALGSGTLLDPALLNQGFLYYMSNL